DRSAQLDPHGRSIGPHIALLARVFGPGPGRQFAERVHVGGNVLGVGDRAEVAPEEFVLAAFHDRAESRVDREHRSAGVTDDHPYRGGSKQLAEGLGARRLCDRVGCRSRNVALLLPVVGSEHADYPADALAGLGMAQRGVEMYLIAVSRADASPGQIPLVDKLADDAMRGALADPNLARDLTQPQVGLC